MCDTTQEKTKNLDGTIPYKTCNAHNTHAEQNTQLVTCNTTRKNNILYTQHNTHNKTTQYTTETKQYIQRNTQNSNHTTHKNNTQHTIHKNITHTKTYRRQTKSTSLGLPLFFYNVCGSLVVSKKIKIQKPEAHNSQKFKKTK